MTSVGDVAVGADGSLAVFDRSERAVVVVSPDGNARRLGRAGSGPGEFSVSARLALGPNGEVAVADVGNASLTLFAPDLSRRWTFRMDRGVPWGVFWNRAGLFVRTHVGNTMEVHKVVEQRGRLGDRILELRDLAPGLADNGGVCLFCPIVVTARGTVIAADADTAYRLTELDDRGSVLREWTNPGAPLVEYAAEEREALARSMRRGEQAAGQRLAAPMPTYKVRVVWLGLAAGGVLLVQHAQARRDSATVLDVFGSPGSPIGAIALDVLARRVVVNEGYLLAVGEDDSGEVFVRYRLSPAPEVNPQERLP